MIIIFWNKTFTTIDIGASAIKVARLKKNGDELELLDVGYTDLPENTIEKGKIIDPSVVAGKLKSTFDKMDYYPSNIVTAISSNNLIIRNIKLPGMKPEELLEDALKWEADEYLPFSVKEAVIDYIIIENNEEYLKIVLVATKKEVVNNHLVPLESINLKPARMNVQPLGLLSLLKFQKKQIPTSVIIDIGSSGTRIIIGDDKGIYLYRTVNIGGYAFTEAIKENLDMDYYEAEKYKIENGIPNEEDVSEDFTASDEVDINLMELNENTDDDFLKSKAKNLSYEISRSLDYFQRNNIDKTIEKIFLTGGGSLMKGLKNVIKSEIDLNLELQSLSPFQAFNNDSSFKLSAGKRIFSVAIGLGYSEVLGE